MKDDPNTAWPVKQNLPSAEDCWDKFWNLVAKLIVLETATPEALIESERYEAQRKSPDSPGD